MKNNTHEGDRHIVDDVLSNIANNYLQTKAKSYAIASQEEISDSVNEFWLHLNLGESIIGPTPTALDKTRELSLIDILNYPEEQLDGLKEAISEFYNISKDNIVLGTGSDCLIETIPRVFVNPGEISLATAPEFFRFKDAHQRAGTELLFVDRDEKDNYTFTTKVETRLIDKINKLKPKVTWISTPNNPSGQIASLEFIANVHEHVVKNGGILVVDEAYGEFNDSLNEPYTAIDLVKDKANQLIVLRTFSKGYGMAGVRVGYGVVSDDIKDGGVFKEWALPYDMNNVGAAIAPLALEDQSHMQMVRDQTAVRRKLMEDAIEENPHLNYVRGSVTNILLAKYNDGVGKDLNDTLTSLGVKVSNQNPYEGTKDRGYARITVGNDEQVKDICNILRRCK